MPWAPVGCGALEVDLSPRPITRAQFFSVGLQWLAFALVWGALTLAPLLQCDPRALPLSLRISLAAAASLFLSWVLWYLQQQRRALQLDLQKFI
jgi:hypothetical protein